MNKLHANMITMTTTTSVVWNMLIAHTCLQYTSLSVILTHKTISAIYVQSRINNKSVMW